VELEILLYGVMGVSTLLAFTGGYVFLKKKADKKDPDALTSSKAPTPVPLAVPDRKKYKTMQEALLQTKAGFWGKLSVQFSGKNQLSQSELDELEEALYTSDLGPKTVDFLMGKVGAQVALKSQFDLTSLNQSLKTELTSIFTSTQSPDLSHALDQPTTVWMVVGVNGAGKTTSIGKLASQQVDAGKRVLIAAGDTFRAAADAT